MTRPGTEPLLFEISSPGKRGYRVDEPGCLEDPALAELEEAGLLRKSDNGLPQVSETEVVRHFTRLSEMNYHLDRGLYPLGSCTMKYNPKHNERLASLPGFTDQHPLLPDSDLQGTYELLWSLDRCLQAVTGFPALSLQPCAGAHGELTSLMMIRAFFRDRGELDQRTTVVVPDSAHGTNPASAAMCGFRVKEIPSGPDGRVDPDVLRNSVGEDCAAVMLTNPNTLGLFEEGILDIAAHCRKAGAKLYCDGANMNALVGRARPADMGFDIMHLNLHKTFGTPHGGGGPGAGPVGCSSELAPYLPVPLVVRDDDGRFRLEWDRPSSIGPVHTFLGNVGVALKAYAYLLSVGLRGLAEISECAVLNANYLRVKLRELLPMPYDTGCMHEFVLSGKPGEGCNVHTLDMAKRLLDLGFHAPTVYFPLIVEEALMIEPTETVGRQELDRFVEAFRRIVREREENPELLASAPHDTPVRRLDETTAARKPVIRFCQCAGE